MAAVIRNYLKTHADKYNKETLDFEVKKLFTKDQKNIAEF